MGRPRSTNCSIMGLSCLCPAQAQRCALYRLSAVPAAKPFVLVKGYLYFPQRTFSVSAADCSCTSTTDSARAGRGR